MIAIHLILPRISFSDNYWTSRSPHPCSNEGSIPYPCTESQIPNHSSATAAHDFRCGYSNGLCDAATHLKTVCRFLFDSTPHGCPPSCSCSSFTLIGLTLFWLMPPAKKVNLLNAALSFRWQFAASASSASSEIQSWTSAFDPASRLDYLLASPSKTFPHSVLAVTPRTCILQYYFRECSRC